MYQLVEFQNDGDGSITTHLVEARGTTASGGTSLCDIDFSMSGYARDVGEQWFAGCQDCWDRAHAEGDDGCHDLIVDPGTGCFFRHTVEL